MEAHLGKTISEILPESAHLIEPLFQKVLSTGEPLKNQELRLAPRDNADQAKYWLGSYFPLQGTCTSAKGVGAVITDITERKLAERELKRLNRAHRVLSECGDRLMRATEEATLLREVCEVAINAGEYRMAWVRSANSRNTCASRKRWRQSGAWREA